MNSITEWIRAVLPQLDGFVPGFLAFGMPAVFLLANALVKRFIFEQKEMHGFGAEMSFCGSVLFVSTLLRGIAQGQVPTGTRAVVYIVLVLAAFFGWLFLLKMGNTKGYKTAWAAAGFGLVVFLFCSVAVWSMLPLTTKGAP